MKQNSLCWILSGACIVASTCFFSGAKANVLKAQLQAEKLQSELQNPAVATNQQERQSWQEAQVEYAAQLRHLETLLPQPLEKRQEEPAKKAESRSVWESGLSEMMGTFTYSVEHFAKVNSQIIQFSHDRNQAIESLLFSMPKAKPQFDFEEAQKMERISGFGTMLINKIGGRLAYGSDAVAQAHLESIYDAQILANDWTRRNLDGRLLLLRAKLIAYHAANAAVEEYYTRAMEGDPIAMELISSKSSDIRSGMDYSFLAATPSFFELEAECRMATAATQGAQIMFDMLYTGSQSGSYAQFSYEAENFLRQYASQDNSNYMLKDNEMVSLYKSAVDICMVIGETMRFDGAAIDNGFLVFYANGNRYRVERTMNLAKETPSIRISEANSSTPDDPIRITYFADGHPILVKTKNNCYYFYKNGVVWPENDEKAVQAYNSAQVLFDKFSRRIETSSKELEPDYEAYLRTAAR